MSWTVSAIGGMRPRLKDPNYEPPVLGTADEVRARISAHLAGVDWSIPDWGTYAGDGFTFEFNVAPEDAVLAVAVHIRGVGDAVVDLLRFAVPNGWHLLDWSTGEIIDPVSLSSDSWERWQAYADHIRAIGRDQATGR